MKPKADSASIQRKQGQLLGTGSPDPRQLTEFIDLQNPLVQLADRIDVTGQSGPFFPKS